MKNAYQVIVKSNQGSAKSTTHDVPQPGSWWGALKVKAIPGARYQLVDKFTGQGPDNIRVKRAGNDLHISFEGRQEADLVITDYYEYTAPGFGAVIGETDPGVYFAYTPESGQTSALMGNLTDGASHIGMALGGNPVAAVGAATGALVAVAGFNPLLAAPLALLAAGGGGGGDGGATDSTPPKIIAARLAPEDDTGVSNSDGITSDNTPRLLITADADAVSATVTVAGKTYTSTTKNDQGQFVVQIPDNEPLGNGAVTYSVVVKDAAGNPSLPWAGSFVVDRSASDNFEPKVDQDANQNITVQIASITEDTGFSSTDFITSDNSLSFTGSVANSFVENGDLVELWLLNAEGKVLASQYVEPVNSGGQWAWTWDKSTQKLADGAYTLTAQVVDKAGNAVSLPPVSQAITVDTNATPDPSAAVEVAVKRLDQDSGDSSTDFLTNQTKLTFSGTVDADLKGKVLVQILNTAGKVMYQDYLDPSKEGAWSYDNTAHELGVNNASTHYVLKASAVDLAGNILKSTDQSFTVDLKAPTFSIAGGSLSGDQMIFKKMDVTAGSSPDFLDSEAGSFTYSHTLPTDGQAITSFAANTFKVTFTDLAGNTTVTSNAQPWGFQLSESIVEHKPSSSLSTFGSGALAGSIGTLVLKPEEVRLDLSTLHSATPQVGDTAVINHIGLSGDGELIAGANHSLQLTTGDVLALGVKNSFMSDGHLQMRIDGDSVDTVVLDDLLGGSTYQWTKASALQNLGSNPYSVYTNEALHLELFIQQAIHVTLV